MPLSRIRFNLAAFNELRNSEGVVAILEERAHIIAAEASGAVRTSIDSGPAFSVKTYHNRSRAVVIVGTANLDGMLAEARDRALTRSIG